MYETLDGLRVGDVEGEGNCLAPVGADLVDELLALLDAPGTQRHRKTMRRKLNGGRRADA